MEAAGRLGRLVGAVREDESRTNIAGDSVKCIADGFGEIGEAEQVLLRVELFPQSAAAVQLDVEQFAERRLAQCVIELEKVILDSRRPAAGDRPRHGVTDDMEAIGVGEAHGAFRGIGHRPAIITPRRKRRASAWTRLR
jgi:hypothetical protein